MHLFSLHIYIKGMQVIGLDMRVLVGGKRLLNLSLYSLSISESSGLESVGVVKQSVSQSVSQAV